MRRRKAKTSIVDFNKTELVEKELVDKFSLWMLRIIVKLGGSKEFLDKNNYFHKDELACFLDIGKFIDMAEDDFKRNEPFDILKINLQKLENRKRFTSSKILTKNIKQISKLMKLNTYEQQILEFVILLDQYDILNDTADLLGSSLNSTQAKKALSVILDISISDINSAFKSNAKLYKSSIITIDKDNTNSLSRKIDIITSEFADNMLNLDEDISEMIKNSVRPCDESALKITDYEYLSKDIDILLPYLKTVCKKRQTGVNILLYGLPGTGKTQLAKVIAKSLKTTLYEIIPNPI